MLCCVDCQVENEVKIRPNGEDSGIVIVCNGGLWKRVCDKGERWTKEDAIVTCRQLDYPYPESKQ